jgi:hypothetical protein
LKVNFVAFATAQSAWDNQSVEEFPDEWTTEDDAYVQALDELLSDSKVLADWIGNECCQSETHDTLRIRSNEDLSVPQALAMAFSGLRESTRALHLLREAFERDHQIEIHERATEILKDQERDDTH